MQKIRKILRAVSEKTALPTNQSTNQPIITNNTDFIRPGWHRPVKIVFDKVNTMIYGMTNDKNKCSTYEKIHFSLYNTKYRYN